jgi:CTP:molybdopterin cytidylyltransferase MocA
MNQPKKNKSSMAAVVLAAGLSERMGRFKPLLPLGTGPAIQRVVQLFQNAGIEDIIVVTGFRADDVQQATASLNVRCVENPDFRTGMFSSVLAGLRALQPANQGFFIHPVDIPLVRTSTVVRLTAIFESSPARILYPTFDRRRGHPTLIHTGLVPQILKWPGTGGLRGFLQGCEQDSEEVPVADQGVLLDMDTPEDYDQMQARAADPNLPSEEECRVLMKEIQALPDPIMAHCRAVADVAQCLAKALIQAGVFINSERIRTAALLHDIARLQKDHAQAGAVLLKSHGFAELAPLVATHMDLEAKHGQPMDEAQVVFLADKLVIGDRCTDLETRFDRKLQKYGSDAGAVAHITRRRENARRIQTEIERITGVDLCTILASAKPCKGETR